MYILQLPNVRCYHSNHEIKGDFCSFEYVKINKFRTELISECPKLNCPKFFLWRFYKEFVWQAKEIVRK